MKRNDRNDRKRVKLVVEKETLRELKPRELELGAGGLRRDDDLSPDDPSYC